MLLERCPTCNKLYPKHHKQCPACAKPQESKKAETAPLNPKMAITGSTSKTSKLSMAALPQETTTPVKPPLPAARPSPPGHSSIPSKPASMMAKSSYMPSKPPPPPRLSSPSKTFAFPAKDKPKQINYVPYSVDGVGIQCASCGKYSPTDKNFCIHCGSSFI